MRTDLTNLLIAPNATLREAMQSVDQGRVGIVLVVDSSRRLLGTVTDGDTRRALLRGVELEAAVEQVMNRRFVAVGSEATESAILDLMRVRSIRQVPAVDVLYA